MNLKVQDKICFAMLRLMDGPLNWLCDQGLRDPFWLLRTKGNSMKLFVGKNALF
ncbi:hypothetical protein [Bartonella koehlerae]|uniref:hypothetical protein n=1 Tax=Bartonella koehlerae TaxID=92181 RepID=UPI0012B63DF4|nr:hypothetical protein [Bartonella koehlerae]